MLRAVRFEKRLGFQIEDRTAQLLEEAKPLLERVSGDRIRHELDLVLKANHSVEILARLQELNLLEKIHPSLYWDAQLITPLEKVLLSPIADGWELPSMAGNIPLPRFLAYLVLLSRIPRSQIAEIAKRLRLSATMKTALLHLNTINSEIHSYPTLSPSRVVRRLEKISPVILYAAYQITPSIEEKKIIQKYISEWKKIKPFTDGHALQASSIPPGPIYEKILERLRSAWLDSEIKSKKEEQNLLRDLIEHYSPK